MTVNMSTQLFLLVPVLVMATASYAVAREEAIAAVANTDTVCLPGNCAEVDLIEMLKQNIRAQAVTNPGIFDERDLAKLDAGEGLLAAYRFLNQRDGNVNRASELASDVLKWRKAMLLNNVDASSFPCDLFKMGLIFESGHAHIQMPTGEYMKTNPVIWIRLGALGKFVKLLERFTLKRLVPFGANKPRSTLHRNKSSTSSACDLRHRQPGRQRRILKLTERSLYFNGHSVRENKTVRHVLRAIAWWLEDWIRRNPEAQATLVLDFEDTDFAFASWTVGEFLVKLDDNFPDLFDRIIGFRYKAKLWSLHWPISMFTRIFKSVVASSPETDRKLRFIDKEYQISAYMPRVDENGVTMLPRHVSGQCHLPDNFLAPANCNPNLFDAANQNKLFDPNLWQEIYNEFYYKC